MNTNFHTESRMRENCTYGSMRGRAYPTRGVPLYSTPFSVPGTNLTIFFISVLNFKEKNNERILQILWNVGARCAVAVEWLVPEASKRTQQG